VRPVARAVLWMAFMRVTTALLALAVVAHRVNGQGSDSAKTAHPSSSVALFDIVLANDRPGAPDPNDSAKAVLATQKLRESLANAPGVRLIDSARVAAAESSPEAKAASLGKPCNLIAACAQVVGRKVGAQWAVTGTLGKSTNVNWAFSGRLLSVGTGNLALDDSFQLRGDPTAMIPPGMAAFARRVAKQVSGQTGQ
jgi:uncharacterized protein DUF2380